jgi:DNA-binding transcriptional MerR regulator
MANKGKQEGMTRKQVASRFGVSVSTVRSWQRQFSDWLDVETKAYGGGRQTATTYSDSDLAVFAVVKRLSGPPDHLPFKTVKERLDNELATVTLDAPVEEEATEEQATSMVIWTEYAATVAKLKGTEGELKGVQGELKAVTEDRDWLRERHDKLDEERADLQRQLDEERQKSWLKKLFRR